MTAAIASSAASSRSRDQSRRDPGGSSSDGPLRATSGPCTYTEIRRRRRPARKWNRQVPGIPMVASNRRTRPRGTADRLTDVLRSRLAPDKPAPIPRYRPARVRCLNWWDRLCINSRPNASLRSLSGARHTVIAESLTAAATDPAASPTESEWMIGDAAHAAGNPRIDACASSDRTPVLPLTRGRARMVANGRRPYPKEARRTWARTEGGVAIGRPLASEEEAGERLSKKKALRDLQLGRDQLVGISNEEIIRVLGRGRVDRP